MAGNNERTLWLNQKVFDLDSLVRLSGDLKGGDLN